MAHLIDMSNRRANIAYQGPAPWHGLGVELPNGADLIEWRKKAGLDFKVKTAPVKYDVIHGEDQPCPTVEHRVSTQKVVTYREDTGASLGVVAKRYKIVQPHEVLDFFNEFARAGDMKISVAGSIMGGRRVWALAEHQMEIRVAGDDVVRPYFLLTTSFDGETATIGTFTTTRVVCYNTMNMVYNEVKADGTKGYSQAGFSIPHIHNFDAEVARKHVEKLVLAATQFEKGANEMAEKGISEEQALGYFVGLVGVKEENGLDLTRQSRAKVDTLMRLYKTGPGAGMKSAASTVWGALNAVTRYVDHEANERKAGGRWTSALYGNGKELKAKAFRVAQWSATKVAEAA